MLALGSGTSPRTRGKEEGLQANVLFAFPFILPLPMWQNGCGEHPLARVSCQGHGMLVVPIQQGRAEVWLCLEELLEVHQMLEKSKECLFP